METTKICIMCNTQKEINQFNKNKTKKDGLSSECKECIKIYKKEYRLKNAEKIKVGRKKYYEANKEKVLRDNSKWKQENREHHNKTSREYHIKNREKILEYNRSPKRKLSQRLSTHKRRAIIKEGSIKTEDLQLLIENSKTCYWCNTKINKKEKAGYHLDHYIPLSKGGTHTLENIVISCPSCNKQKHAKDPYQFAQERGRLF